MSIVRLPAFVPALALAASFLPLRAAEFTLGSNGAFQGVTVGSDHATLSDSLGGFFAHDVVANAALDLSKGKVTKEGDKTVYDSGPALGISLHAEFIPKDNYVQVNGYLENANQNDRAIILEYRLGLTGSDAVFSNSLNRSEDVAVAGKSSEGNAVPVAALSAGGQAVAIGLSPTEPVAFGLAGSAQGLSAKFYVGITPVTKAFPNRAAFSFAVYPVKPTWGFRSALAKYYSFYPDLYEQRFKRLGFMLGVGKGAEPVNMDQYAINVIEMQSPFVKHDMKRDADHKTMSVFYMLVGQREIKFLDTLPANYDEAMSVYQHWSPESLKGHPVTKEFVCSGTDEAVQAEIKSSAVEGPDGKFVIEIRQTQWGKNSITFKVDPSPYLFRDTDVPTVGKVSTNLLDDWIKAYPQISGVIVDSLGPRWPAVADYRKEHFAYTQYPLTFDSTGRLFLHNVTSHYEWVQFMHDKLKAEGRILLANGMYAYFAKPGETYLQKNPKDKVKVGRFYIAALLDGEMAEGGIRTTTDRVQDMRIMMGRKYTALSNVEWTDPTEVENFFNRMLSYGVFGVNSARIVDPDKYVEGVNEAVPYVNNKDGYYRFKDLADWFLANNTLLNQAGWQPETDATVTSGGGVYIERFGNGNDIYFTLFNDSDQKADTTVRFDFKALGASSANFDEITRKTKMDVNNDEVKISLEPHKTYIVKLTKTWFQD